MNRERVYSVVNNNGQVYCEQAELQSYTQTRYEFQTSCLASGTDIMCILVYETYIEHS